LYGGFEPGCVLPLSVYGYFANGGSIAYISRIPNSKPAGEPARKELPAADRALGLPIGIESIEADADITMQNTTGDAGEDAEDGPMPFTLTVLEASEPVETFENLTLGSGDRNVQTVVNETSTKVKVDLKLDSDVDLTGQLELLKPGMY